jgi:hypothetical protein
MPNDEQRIRVQITLLGPQRRPTVDQVVAGLDADLRFATVTAGWQEREPDDDELDSLLGGRTVNLNLYGRWLDIQEHDPEYAVAELEHRTYLEELRLLYLVQLESAGATIQLLASRNGDRPEAIQAALADARAVIRLLDDNHTSRVRAADEEFSARLRTGDRPVIAEHLAQVRHALAEAGALVITGGHVGVLLRMLRLFEVSASVPDVVIAWSAGAMALTERVVLFHDRTPQGLSPSEIYGDGLGVIRDVVMLPHARRRLRIDDPLRMATLAQRFEPATCVVLDDEVRLNLEPDGSLPADARVLDPKGHIVSRGAA